MIKIIKTVQIRNTLYVKKTTTNKRFKQTKWLYKNKKKVLSQHIETKLKRIIINESKKVQRNVKNTKKYWKTIFDSKK